MVTPGDYQIHWGVRFSRLCVTVATIDDDLSHEPPTPAFIIDHTSTVGNGGNDTTTFVDTYSQSGQMIPHGFDLAVVC